MDKKDLKNLGNNIKNVAGAAKDTLAAAGSNVAEGIKQIHDSEQLEKVSDGIKAGAGKAADGVKAGVEKAADGVKAGAGKAVEAIKGAKAKADENKAEKEKAKTEKHLILEIGKTGIKLLVPDGYVKLKYKNPAKEALKKRDPDVYAYRKMVGHSDNVFTIFETTAEKAMNFEDEQDLIDGIHEAMSEIQGLIEVKSGKTKRGYDYIYSIVKTYKEEKLGNLYYLRMNLRNEDKIVEVNASFDEIGCTGLREAMGAELARRAGVADIFAEGKPGWNEDPYDPMYKRGHLMNVCEREGIDGLFPDNPLTQAREFILAVIMDELVIEKKEDEDTDNADENAASGEQEKTPEEQKEEEKEFCKSLFVNECRRHRYSVDV